MIFTTNLPMTENDSIFPTPWNWKGSHAPTGEQHKAILRRYELVKIDGPLQKIGRPLTKAEQRARREKMEADEKKALSEAIAAAAAAAEAQEEDAEDSSGGGASSSSNNGLPKRRRITIADSSDSDSEDGSVQVQSDELHVHVHEPADRV